MDVNKLIPYEFNNRKHPEQQVERIARSIKEFGFNQPIVIDEENVVLVGHGRLYAAKKLGLDDVPVKVVKGLTDEQKRAYRILDNKLQNDSTWDFGNVELELGWLEDNGLDLEPWGLDELRFGVEELDPPDIGGAERETDYSRTFTLTQEQAELVDRAVADVKNATEADGNANAYALVEICRAWLADGS